MQITDLHRNDSGVWCAIIRISDSETALVDRMYGSWRYTPPEEGKGHKSVSASLAAKLQERVRKIEKAERRAVGTDGI